MSALAERRRGAVTRWETRPARNTQAVRLPLQSGEYMQPTYYERLLADEELGLAGILDSDIALLTASGSLHSAAEDPSLIDCRSRYIKSAVLKVKQAMAASMSAECAIRRERPASSLRASQRFHAPVTVFTVNSTPIAPATVP